MRIGHGYDVHRFVKGRKLMLCGVEVEYELGLLGHSDADVALHALADSILGALALGDIGKLFPDRDPRYKDADSALLRYHHRGPGAEAGPLHRRYAQPYCWNLRLYRGADQRQGHHRGGSWLHRSAGGDCGPCGLPAPEAGDFSGKSVTPRPAAA